MNIYTNRPTTKQANMNKHTDIQTNKQAKQTEQPMNKTEHKRKRKLLWHKTILKETETAQ